VLLTTSSGVIFLSPDSMQSTYIEPVTDHIDYLRKQGGVHFASFKYSSVNDRLFFP
jgi:hypothetical protein